MFKEKIYTFDEIKKNDNLIFNLRLDTMLYIKELLYECYKYEFVYNDGFILANIADRVIKIKIKILL